ncbi:hypothetical protein U27_01550 [Candidatus Vecturithrix granuli]|uniref:Uncharacterized protein n=1 Tax=Vecturithrix granuli TaxID=1499967 RepID=A0A081CAP4_VECG1|nr:hypothetical protein U27_01550 [Candidatus Vecturithrix granuli]
MISGFQTLPGIIPRFYSSGRCTGLSRSSPFQTLPGIIPRFYFSCFFSLMVAISSFKPFQGLFRVSTIGEDENTTKKHTVSNPSRDYSAFLRALPRPRSSVISPSFQTLPGIIPRFYGRPAAPVAPENGVSNPSRDYSAFLPSATRKPTLMLRWFQTLPGIIPRFYNSLRSCSGKCIIVSNPSRDYSAFLLSPKGVKEFEVEVSNPSRDYSAFLREFFTKASPSIICFKPFQGLFRVSTICI